MPEEAAQIAKVLDRIARGALGQLDGLPEELLNRKPPLPAANTLYALATHLVGAGEFWVLALAGGRSVERDRSAEFQAEGGLAGLRSRFERWLQAVHEVLDRLPDAALDLTADPPEAYRGAMGDQPLSVRDCLLHAIEHSALHQGQIEITRQLLTQSVRD